MIDLTCLEPALMKLHEDRKRISWFSHGEIRIQHDVSGFKEKYCVQRYLIGGHLQYKLWESGWHKTLRQAIDAARKSKPTFVRHIPF